MHLPHTTEMSLLVWWYIKPDFLGAVLSSNLDAHACFFNQLDRAILAAHVLEVLGVALCRLPGPIHPRAFRHSFACIRCCLPRCKGYGSTRVVRKAQRGRNKVYGGRE